MRIISLGKRSGKTLCYGKELRHVLENTNKRELVDRIIREEKIILDREQELKEIRNLLTDFEIQNRRLQEEVVRLRMNCGENVITGDNIR